jgi:hypothetical protein
VSAVSANRIHSCHHCATQKQFIGVLWLMELRNHQAKVAVLRHSDVKPQIQPDDVNSNLASGCTRTVNMR